MHSAQCPIAATVLMGVGWMNYRDPTARSLAVRAQLPVSEAPASRALALQSVVSGSERSRGLGGQG